MKQNHDYSDLIFFCSIGENQYLEKILQPPYREHFQYWLLNIVEQNENYDAFPKMIARWPEVLKSFFMKQWHDVASGTVRSYIT